MTISPSDAHLVLALAYGRALIGTPYGWWDKERGNIHAGPPFFAGTEPLPPPGTVRCQSLACAGLVNLVVRAAGCVAPPGGGTQAYGKRFKSNSDSMPTIGALCDPRYLGAIVGRRFRPAKNGAHEDEGHVAIVVEGGLLLQSFSTENSPWPGVNMLLTVEQSEAYFGEGERYFEYAVPFERWREELKAA